MRRASRHIIVKTRRGTTVGPPSPASSLQSILHPVGRQFLYKLTFLCFSLTLDLQWFLVPHASLTLHPISPMTCHKNGLFLTAAVLKVGFKSPLCGGWGPSALFKEFVRLSLIQWRHLRLTILCVLVQMIYCNLLTEIQRTQLLLKGSAKCETLTLFWYFFFVVENTGIFQKLHYWFNMQWLVNCNLKINAF